MYFPYRFPVWAWVYLICQLFIFNVSGHALGNVRLQSRQRGRLERPQLSPRNLKNRRGLDLQDTERHAIQPRQSLSADVLAQLDSNNNLPLDDKPPPIIVGYRTFTQSGSVVVKPDIRTQQNYGNFHLSNLTDIVSKHQTPGQTTSLTIPVAQGTVTPEPIPTQSLVFETQTLSGVTGKPGAFSQISTTDNHGVATVLPVWFTVEGAAIVVVVVAGTLSGKAPPPPVGFPPLVISPNGEAQPAHQPLTPFPRNTRHDLQASPSNRRSLPATSTDQHRQTTTQPVSQPSSQSPASPTNTNIAQGPKYLIVPKDGKDPKNKDLTADLSQTFGAALYTVENAINGILMWQAPLSSAQVDQYLGNALVSTVRPDPVYDSSDEGDGSEPGGLKAKRKTRIDDELNKRDGPNKVVVHAFPDLVTLSHPPNVKTLPAQNYVYDSAGGSGVTVYVVDTGAIPDTQDWDHNTGIKRWLYVQPTSDDEWDWKDVYNYPSLNAKYDHDGHGAAMVSKAVGGLYGVARAANLVVVREPIFKENGKTTRRISHWIDAFNKILGDIVENKLEGKAVVNLSFRGNVSPQDRVIIDIAQLLLNTLIDSVGAVVVCSANNLAQETRRGRLRSDIDDYPALWVKSGSPLIVVGSVNETGHKSLFSQGIGDSVTVYAQGERVKVDALATAAGVQGTSISTAHVSGLAAYLMSVPSFQGRLSQGGVGQTAKNVRDLIVELSYPRVADQPAVAFNGVYWVEPSSCLRGRDFENGDCDQANVTQSSQPSNNDSNAVIESLGNPSPSQIPASLTALAAITTSTPVTADPSKTSVIIQEETQTPAQRPITQTRFNSDGSGLCLLLPAERELNPCVKGWSQYDDDFVYKSLTSYYDLPSGIDGVTFALGPIGCAAQFNCEGDGTAEGMSGKEIKDAFEILYQSDGVRVCGSAYLSNGCHVTANACTFCVSTLPEGAPAGVNG